MQRLLAIIFLTLSINSIALTQQTIGLFLNDSLSQNGYTLWTTNRSSFLIDNCGYQINRWDHNKKPGLSVYLLENGNLLRTAQESGNFSGPGEGGLIQEFDWDGNLVWSYLISNPRFKQHHDIEPLPNGNFLAIAWELKTISEVATAGGKKLTSYWSEMILELEKIDSADARVVWEWHMWDHLVQDFDSTKDNYAVISDHPELMDINYIPPVGSGFGGADWLHFNGIDYDAERDEIILSARRTNEIYIIDHSTTTEEASSHSGGNRGRGGDILYRWGNPEAYGLGTNSDRKLFGQHNATIIPTDIPEAGAITIFNNGSERPEGFFSTIEEILPPRHANGDYLRQPNQAFGPGGGDWQYVANPPETFFSRNISGAQRLPNGNTLICSGVQAHFFEVNTAGEIVWSYVSPIGVNGPITQGDTGSAAGKQNIFRAERYLPDFPGFQDKDMTPGELIELEPLPSDCEIFEEVTSTSSGIELAAHLKIYQDFSHQKLRIENTGRIYYTFGF